MNSHKLTFGTPFPLGTLDTVTLAKCRQKLQFIVSSFKKKKKKLNREKRPSKVCKREEIMTAEEFFPLSLFPLLCWKFHPSKSYFLVTGFTLMPASLRTSSMDNHLIKYLLQKKDTIPRQNVLQCCSSDLATLYDHRITE